jgi:hypothetical protein
MIDNWERLEEEIRAAAENNSKQYKVPGDWMSRQVPQEIELAQQEKWDY